MWWRLALIIGGAFLFLMVFFTIKTIMIIKALHQFHFPLPEINFLQNKKKE